VRIPGSPLSIPGYLKLNSKKGRFRNMKFVSKSARACFAFASAVLMLSPLTFAQGHHRNHASSNDNSVVRWKSIKSVITAPDIDNPVGVVTVEQAGQVVLVNPGISAGTTPWTTTQGRAQVNLQTGAASFEVEGLVLNGGNNSGTPGRVDQVEGSLICNSGTTDETISTTSPVPLSSTGNAEFSGNIGTVPSSCANPLFLIRIGPDLPAANERWIATGAVRVSGDGDYD
jgi:hypothetical protein